MTTTEKAWITQKERELQQQTQQFGGAVLFWDAYRFLDLIHKLQRENRRLRVQLGAKLK